MVGDVDDLDLVDDEDDYDKDGYKGYDGAGNDNDHECNGDDDDSGRTFDIACSSCSKPFLAGHLWLLLVEPVMIDDQAW